MLLDRAQQLRTCALDPVVLGDALLDLEPRLPESVNRRFPDRSDVKHVTWLERTHLLEDRPRRKRVAEAEKVVDAILIQVEAMIRQIAQCRDFRRKRETALLLGEEQRLDPDRI